MFYLLLKKTKARKVPFDKWIVNTASTRLRSSVIYYTPKKILVDYDVTLRPKDLIDFVDEISNYSKHFTYYYHEQDIDQAILPITPVRKQPLPTKCTLNIKDDTIWNIIPLGEAVNHELKKITPIGWWLNNENKREDMVPTLPSSHILISGSTGSGKSVLQNCIIGHISRFPNNFQLFLCDIKKVEFGPLRNLQSVKKVAIELDEVDDIISSVRKIMLDRFRMMEKMEVNDIYKLSGKEIPFVIINGKKYQEDEIFNCRINGKEKLMTAKEIAEEFEKENR